MISQRNILNKGIILIVEEQKLYYKYSDYLREKYGEKVYKLFNKIRFTSATELVEPVVAFVPRLEQD